MKAMVIKMKILKESEKSCVTSGHTVLLTYKIEKLSVSDCKAEKVINMFLSDICDNVKKYVTEHLAKEEEALLKSDESRQKRLNRIREHFSFTLNGTVVRDKYLSLECYGVYKDKSVKRYAVICLDDGKLENAESFCARKKIKKYIKDDISLSNDLVTVFHKNKRIKFAIEK